MLTLRQLRAFVAASGSLSFTAAAQKLNVTQSAVSLLIRDLEAQLGVSLFERGRQLSLTPAGHDFARSAAKLLADLELAVSNIRDADASRRSVMRVGVGHLLAATVFPFVVETFRRRHPAISIEIHDRLVEQLPKMVLDREVDFAIGSIRPSGGTAELRFDPLFQDSIHTTSIFPAAEDAIPRTPGRPAAGGLAWDALRQEPMIVVNAGNGIWTAASAALALRDIRLTVAHRVALYSTGIALARRGQGRLLIPGFCAFSPDLTDLGIRPLTDPVVRWDVSVLYRRGAPLGPRASELVEILRTAVS